MRAGEIADAGVVHVGGLVSRNHIVPDAHLLLLLLLSLSLCRTLARSLFVGGVLSSTTLLQWCSRLQRWINRRMLAPAHVDCIPFIFMWFFFSLKEL